MNLYEICLEVLKHASESKINLDDEMSRETLATEIYDLFYEYQTYNSYCDSGYLVDLKDYWSYKQDLDEDE